MVIFAQQSTPRLQHMAAWLGNYLFGKPISVITNENELIGNEYIFNYSDQSFSFPTFQLRPHSLLFENDIRHQEVVIQDKEATPYFFETSGDFPFDILAASFYLLQRYEEFFSHEKDEYGRYAHTNSLAFRNNFLHLPLVDIWIQQLKTALQKKFPAIQFAPRHFQFLPTYDVDIAYSYKGKGFLRSAGGLLRSLLNGQIKDFLKRIKFLLSGKNDPFDVFKELDELHQQYFLQPIYFFLLAQKQKGIDKNIPPENKDYQQLVVKLGKQYKTGIHLSGAASASFATMQAEKKILEMITGNEISGNRMHYLLFHLPETYQQLQKFPLNITQDFSMGYGTINGFRASTCTPYFWYDLSLEKSTALKIFPFCYMEANSIFEQKGSTEKALKEMKAYLQIIQQVQGCYITIFHNHLISRNKDGRQWMNMYKQFLSYLASDNFTS